MSTSIDMERDGSIEKVIIEAAEHKHPVSYSLLTTFISNHINCFDRNEFLLF